MEAIPADVLAWSMAGHARHRQPGPSGRPYRHRSGQQRVGVFELGVIVAGDCPVLITEHAACSSDRAQANPTNPGDSLLPDVRLDNDWLSGRQTKTGWLRTHDDVRQAIVDTVFPGI